MTREAHILTSKLARMKALKNLYVHGALTLKDPKISVNNVK